MVIGSRSALDPIEPQQQGQCIKRTGGKGRSYLLMPSRLSSISRSISWNSSVGADLSFDDITSPAHFQSGLIQLNCLIAINLATTHLPKLSELEGVKLIRIMLRPVERVAYLLAGHGNPCCSEVGPTLESSAAVTAELQVAVAVISITSSDSSGKRSLSLMFPAS